MTEVIKMELLNDECVGTLLVHKTDMEELSKTGGNLQKRITEKISHLPPPSEEDILDMRIGRGV